MESILLSLSLGIVLGVVIYMTCKVDKLHKRHNILFDSIITNHQRIDSMQELLEMHQIDGRLPIPDYSYMTYDEVCEKLRDFIAGDIHLAKEEVDALFIEFEKGGKSNE